MMSSPNSLLAQEERRVCTLLTAQQARLEAYDAVKSRGLGYGRQVDEPMIIMLLATSPVFLEPGKAAIVVAFETIDCGRL